MDKAQAIHKFWSGFGLPAYDENTVNPDAETPYITYEVKTDSLGNIVQMTASLWYHSESWQEISRKAEQIAAFIYNMTPPCIKIDNGRLYIAKGAPFAQRMDDPGDKKMRRIVLTIQVEFQTAY